MSPLASGCCGRNTHVFPHCRPRYPQRDTIYPRPVQSLPPLRAFLRNEGIDTAIDPRQPCRIDATHEIAREEARRRAIRAATARYVLPEQSRAQSRRLPSVLGWVQCWSMNTMMVLLSMDNQRFGLWTKCAGWGTTKGRLLFLRSSTLMDGGHRNRDRGESSSPYPKVARRSIPSSSLNGDDRHVRKSFASSRPYASRGTVEERMSREVETFV